MLGSLPTASQQAGHSPLEVSPSELMAASCLPIAGVFRMERPGGLRIGTHEPLPSPRSQAEALHVVSDHTKELSHCFR